MEGDLKSLSKYIFIGEVKPKNSIQILGNFESTKDLFEALLMLFTYGMKLLYSIDGIVNLVNLTESEFLDFSKRFQSIGITPNYKVYHISQVKGIKGIEISKEEIDDWLENKDKYSINLPNKYLLDYKLQTSKNISDFYFSLSCVCMNVYIINFSLCK